jgi:hypothetical protein
MARLEREARRLASLNHPHIGAIYGFLNQKTRKGTFRNDSGRHQLARPKDFSSSYTGDLVRT